MQQKHELELTNLLWPLIIEKTKLAPIGYFQLGSANIKHGILVLYIMNAEDLVDQVSNEGLIYIPSDKKFVSPSLQAAVSKFGPKRILALLTTVRIKSIINATRSNYRNIKRMCDTTQDPSYCYMSEAILPYLEGALDEFEQGINVAKPLRVYSIDESNKAGGVLIEIYKPTDY